MPPRPVSAARICSGNVFLYLLYVWTCKRHLLPKATETFPLILSLAVRLEQMGNAKRTVARRRAKRRPCVKFSCIRVRNQPVRFLPSDADQVLTFGDDGPGLRFRQVGKELEFGVAPASGGAASRASVRI